MMYLIRDDDDECVLGQYTWNFAHLVTFEQRFEENFRRALPTLLFDRPFRSLPVARKWKISSSSLLSLEVNIFALSLLLLSGDKVALLFGWAGHFLVQRVSNRRREWERERGTYLGGLEDVDEWSGDRSRPARRVCVRVCLERNVTSLCSINDVLCSRHANITKREREKNEIFVCWQTRLLSYSHFFRLFALADEESRQRQREREKERNRPIKKTGEEEEEEEGKFFSLSSSGWSIHLSHCWCASCSNEMISRSSSQLVPSLITLIQLEQSFSRSLCLSRLQMRWKKRTRLHTPNERV